jgi:integrase
MARNLTDKGVAILKPKTRIYHQRDPQMPGHFIRVRPTGSKQFVAMTRNPFAMNDAGKPKQEWHTIGTYPLIGIEEARAKAREIINRVKTGQRVDGPESFDTVANEWLKRHVEAKGLRSEPAVRRNLRNHVLPAWGGRDFKSIGRTDVTKLCDAVEDNAGPVQADMILGTVTSIFKWFAKRNDNYNSPIISGMRRTSERARERILNDDEIRIIWSKATGTFGDMVKMLFLTAQRREKVASMRWEDVSVDGTWSVKKNMRREKGTGGQLVLAAMAVDILAQRPRLEGNPHVFAGRGDGYFIGWGKAKVIFDQATGVTGWTLHDLRRTARSLMSRAGVRPDIAERVLGHVQRGVVGTYDRHSYRDEKAQALRMLAGLIDNILRNDDADRKVRRLRG